MRLKLKARSWRRPSNGKLHKLGDIIEPTREELRRMETRQQIGTIFEVVTETVEITEAGRAALQEAPGGDTDEGGKAPGAEQTDASSDAMTPAKVAKPEEEWTLKMSAELYVRLHPDGPKAALAKAWVAYLNQQEA